MPVANPPELSAEQRLNALRKAAESRKLRAEFKAQVKAGAKQWRDAFTSSDEAIRKMRVKELLLSIPGFGVVRADSIMEKAGISPTRRVQGVGKSQFDSLLRLMKEDL